MRVRVRVRVHVAHVCVVRVLCVYVCVQVEARIDKCVQDLLWHVAASPPNREHAALSSDARMGAHGAVGGQRRCGVQPVSWSRSAKFICCPAVGARPRGVSS